MKTVKKISTFIICVMLTAVITGCSPFGRLKKAASGYAPPPSASKDGWQQHSSGDIVLENASVKMNFNADTTHFSVTDKRNGVTYFSANPESDDEAGTAELEIIYYDSESQKNEMYSDKHSVRFKSYEVFAGESALRVYYTLKLEEGRPFVPAYLSEDDYHFISQALTSSEKLKLKLFYSYYAADNQTIEGKAIKEKYEYAKENGLYVIKSTASDSEYNAVYGYAAKAGYTEAMYNESLDRMKIIPDSGDASVSFTVPVEYTLTDDGFEAAVLSDLIEAANAAYTLQSLKLLPYFNCAVATDKNGFILVPDGSGSLISLETADNASYSQTVYGADISRKNQSTSVMSQNAVMPVFGFSSGSGSYFSYITSGAQAADINASRSGNTTRFARAYASFTICDHDDFSARMNNAEQAVFAKNKNNDNPAVRYVLLGKNAQLSEMAGVYRDYLTQNGLLQSEQASGGLNVYLDYTGYITVESSFFGVPYQKKVILTTVRDIIENVKALTEGGVSNIFVRLDGYSHGGKYHSMISEFDIEPAVGTVTELNELSEILEKSGGGLFLESDFMQVYKDSAFDRFSSTTHTIRRLDKTLASASDPDIVSLKDDKNLNVRYLLSPGLYMPLSESYLGSFPKELSENIGCSFGDMGRMLLSDYNTKLPYSRVQTKNAVTGTLGSIKKSVMINTGNDYTWKYAGHILNAPLNDSGFYSASTSVPFYSMVIAGRIAIAGEAANTSLDTDSMLFRILISGANLHYECVTNREELMQLEGSQRLYPTAFHDLQDSIISDYKSLRPIYQKTAGAAITDYKQLKQGAYLIGYSNHTAVLINTGETDFEYGGKSIAAGSYTLLEGGQEES